MHAATGDFPVLVVDASPANCHALAVMLRRFGLKVDTAVSHMAACVALRQVRYSTIVLAADLSRRADRAELLALRRRVPRTWIIAISLQPCPHAEKVAFRWGADSTLEAPWAVEELASRLSAFSHRSRPP
jgi:DNA-binding response OmpR family regulator